MARIINLFEIFSHNGITHILYISYRSILVLYILVATHGHSASLYRRLQDPCDREPTTHAEHL
jgi:hypothetical protein